MARIKKGRLINGLLILDKPAGISSNAALQKVKYLFQAQKAGHTGSLDPLATGVLPICLGEATKLSHYLLDANKCYRAKCILGAVTTTGDSEGEILTQSVVPILDKSQLLSLINSFLGTQEQMPPMFSALKHKGRPLYEYARKGIEIARKTRQITIFDLKLLDFNLLSEISNTANFLEIEVHCSKGTYIRSLCEDIGKALGCGAYISELRRLESGPFKLEQAVTLTDLTEQYGVYSELDENKKNALDSLLLASDQAITSIPDLHLSQQQFELIQHGHSIDVDKQVLLDHPIKTERNAEIQHYRLYFNTTLVALAILDKNEQIKPKRLLFL
jgi:tRNA pseudouridine55 synthase